MSIESVLYAINVISNLDTCVAIIFILSLVFIILTLSILSIGYLIEDRPQEFANSALFKFISYLFKNAKWIILVTIMSCIIPSEKTMYLMIGANYFKNSSLPPKIEMIINNKLDELSYKSVKVSGE